MKTVLKCVLAMGTMGWIYGLGRQAGKDELIEKMETFVKGMEAAKSDEDTEEA